MDKFLVTCTKTANMLADNLGKDGKLTDEKVGNDLCSQYKLVTLLAVSGHTAKAHNLLDRIKKDFMQVKFSVIVYIFFLAAA